MASVHQFLCHSLVLFVGAFWFSVETYLRPLFAIIRTYILSFKMNDHSCGENLKNSVQSSEENFEECSEFVEPKTEPVSESEPIHTDAMEKLEEENDGLGKKGATQFFFNFKFPTYEEFSRNKGTKRDFVCWDEMPSTSTSEYKKFTAGKNFFEFTEELDVLNFNIQESNTNENDISLGEDHVVGDGFLSNKDFKLAEAIHEDNGDVPDQIVALASNEGRGQLVHEENYAKNDQDEHGSAMDSNSESGFLDNVHSFINSSTESYSDGFLSAGDLGGEFEFDASVVMDGNRVEFGSCMSDPEEHNGSEHFDEEDNDMREEFRSLQGAHLQSFSSLNSKFMSEKEFKEEAEPISGTKAKPEAKNPSTIDSEDASKLETLWEHQDLIEQLQMELKKVRATGLPTIFEESESPKLMEDLKPWKIEERFHHDQDRFRMGELHKFYKSYRERMRKFDILNYQKMYAIGFLQLKDPLQSISSQKPSAPALTSLFLQNIKPSIRKRNESDPMTKFIRELESDLEVVYVGQMCLSWEILQWQYDKALDIWESDPQCIRRYNEVAGEFQQFQVLMQRFIENEPFQGPRVQNYVKNRCILRNLLQVPIIREDSSKDRKRERKRERSEYAITSDTLVEVIEESIRIFWQFIRADKDCTSVNIKSSRMRNAVEVLQDPADVELLQEVQTDLLRKERKLKDLLRSGKCILRRFRKCQEDDGSDQVLYFFAQVDMKLVSRVVNMSKISSEQLIWCQNKLRNISLVNRKIHVETSFLLFPC